MNRKENIPEIGLIGLSHKTASVEMRELFSLEDNQISEYMDRLHAEGTMESVCLSTCNRVEIYFASDNIHSSVESILRILEEVSSIPRENFESLLYRKYSRDAIIHLFAVSSSLDSLVVGEDEILGQVKEAYRKASDEKRTGQILNKLFHNAFKTSKRVRTETEIARNPLSIAYIATELAKSIFDDFSKRKALLIGAGEMGELILKYFSKFNIREVVLANRSFHNAERIAREINREAHIIPLDDIYTAAGHTDIIISSVSSPEYIVNPDDVRAIIRKRGKHPLFIIDISVPRSVDPEVGKIRNVYLYNVDDLKSIADENLKTRLREVEMAKRLLESDADEFFSWYDGLEIIPTIVELQKRFDEIREQEVEKYKRKKLKHISDDDFRIIKELTSQIMTKTLHNPITYLKNGQNGGEEDKAMVKEIANTIGKVFQPCK